MTEIFLDIFQQLNPDLAKWRHAFRIFTGTNT